MTDSRPIAGSLRMFSVTVSGHCTLTQHEIAALLVEGIPAGHAVAALARLDCRLEGLVRAVEGLRGELERVRDSAAQRDAADRVVLDEAFRALEAGDELAARRREAA